MESAEYLQGRVTALTIINNTLLSVCLMPFDESPDVVHRNLNIIVRELARLAYLPHDPLADGDPPTGGDVDPRFNDGFLDTLTEFGVKLLQR